MPSSTTQENIYTQRINAVIAYVREHLDDDLSLDTLAQVASFSPFHFHRIFKSITDETVNDLVMRLRIERAAVLLRSSPNLSITEAAFACGFKSASVFSRAFRKRYGITARGWDRQSPLKNSKNGQDSDHFPLYTVDSLTSMADHEAFEVRLRTLPAQRLAYIRVYDSYSDFHQILGAYERLIAWYCQRGGRLSDTTLYGMSQDNPDVTPMRLCRFDWCVSIPADWQAEGEISVQDFPECTVAAIRCTGDINQVDRAVQYLFRYWLPRSRYQPANLPGMEIYHRQPAEIGWETFDIDCAVPIVAL